jgi:hypothetical protein
MWLFRTSCAVGLAAATTDFRRSSAGSCFPQATVAAYLDALTSAGSYSRIGGPIARFGGPPACGSVAGI